ncbi:MAG TPA: ComEA family DNA-binding protein [Rhodanobacteraceae bacterium]|nr:ComEA family DNA-binding protein [Rhodanobacteraceae bacterium]
MKFFVRFLFLLAIFLETSAFAATQVDINSADARTLAQSLSGVGLVKAEAIVAYRTQHGPFKNLDDLAKVKGIGPRILEENREVIVFGKPPSTIAPREEPPRPVANW